MRPLTELAPASTFKKIQEVSEKDNNAPLTASQAGQIAFTSLHTIFVIKLRRSQRPPKRLKIEDKIKEGEYIKDKINNNEDIKSASNFS